MRHHGRLAKARLQSVCAIALVALLLVCGAATEAAPKVSDDLAGPLRVVAAAAASGRAAPAAVSPLVRSQGGLVQVEIIFHSPLAAFSTNLAAYGGRVDIRMDRRVQAWLPAGCLNTVAELPQVAQVRLPRRPVPLQGFGAACSEGVQLTAATAMHTFGIIGSGVTVAVIDIGFGGYDEAEIPGVGEGSGRTISFIGGGGMGGSQHGTAVAEVVADMAPGAEIYLVAVDTNLAIEQAIAYVRDNDFDVAVMSLGIFEGPYDGTHSVSQKVNVARASGVFWVNAAGNHAQRHYEGDWSDRNSDRFHEWSSGDQDMDLSLPAGTFQAFLSWYETAGATTNHDYDLVLVNASGAEVTRSAVTQNGDDPPDEMLVAYLPEMAIYSLRIERMSPDSIPADDHFQLFLPDVDVEGIHQVLEHSLPVPAEASGSFTVGATRGSLRIVVGEPVLPIDEIEEFSSRGPSLSGLLKPNLSAPDYVTTSLVDTPYDPFSGTSAAAPHVAGAAALLLAEDGTRTPAMLAATLQTLAVKDKLQTDPSTNQPMPDNTYGHGRLRLRVGTDTVPPQIRITFPHNGSTITDATPTLIATITDVGGGVDEATIEIRLDGNLVTGNYAPSNGLLTYTVPAGTELTRSEHTLTIDAKDYDGNEATTAVSNFRVAAPSIDAGLHLISLPYADLVNADPSLVFGVPYEQLQLARWVPDDARPVKYHIYPDEYATFNPPDARGSNPIVSHPPAGLGFFVRLPTRCTLNTGGAGPLSDMESYQIKLIYGTDPPRGWNLIGNPYESVVDWGTVSFEADGQRYDLREAMSEEVALTEGVLFDFVSTATGGYYQFSSDPSEDILEYMRGYWVHVLRDATLVMYNPAVTTAVVERPRPARLSNAPTKDQWTLKISAYSGQFQDPVNYIGVHPEGTQGYDIGLDLSEPPALTQGLALYMPQPDWGSRAGHYVRDLRSSLSARQEWDIEVASALSRAPVTLTWAELNRTVPQNVRLILRDLDGNRDTYMRTTSGYTFRTGDGQEIRHFRIIATVAQSGSLAVSALNTANATDGGVTVSYTLTRAATVTADIRNIAGVPIARLTPAEATGGVTQTMSWNGRNHSGARVPNGRYLVRLTASTAEGQTVQAIAVFDKIR